MHAASLYLAATALALLLGEKQHCMLACLHACLLCSSHRLTTCARSTPGACVAWPVLPVHAFFAPVADCRGLSPDRAIRMKMFDWKIRNGRGDPPLDVRQRSLVGLELCVCAAVSLLVVGCLFLLGFAGADIAVEHLPDAREQQAQATSRPRPCCWPRRLLWTRCVCLAFVKCCVLGRVGKSSGICCTTCECRHEGSERPLRRQQSGRLRRWPDTTSTRIPEVATQAAGHSASAHHLQRDQDRPPQLVRGQRGRHVPVPA